MRKTKKAVKKVKRHRRTKAEMARQVEVNTDQPKRKRRTKAELADVKKDKMIKANDADPIFMIGRVPMDINDLIPYLKEKYEPHRGLRVCDRVLQ